MDLINIWIFLDASFNLYHICIVVNKIYSIKSALEVSSLLVPAWVCPILKQRWNKIIPSEMVVAPPEAISGMGSSLLPSIGQIRLGMFCNTLWSSQLIWLCKTQERERRATRNPREPDITTPGIMKLYLIHCWSTVRPEKNCKQIQALISLFRRTWLNVNAVTNNLYYLSHWSMVIYGTSCLSKDTSYFSDILSWI